MPDEIQKAENPKPPEKAKHRFIEFFEEKEGGLSSGRLIYFLWMIGILCAWLFIAFKKGDLPTIGESILILIGMLSGQKLYSRYQEGKEEVGKVKEEPEKK